MAFCVSREVEEEEDELLEQASRRSCPIGGGWGLHPRASYQSRVPGRNDIREPLSHRSPGSPVTSWYL